MTARSGASISIGHSSGMRSTWRGASVIFIVINNGMYGTIRMNQETAYPGRVIATDLCNPDFAALARLWPAAYANPALDAVANLDARKEQV